MGAYTVTLKQSTFCKCPFPKLTPLRIGLCGSTQCYYSMQSPLRIINFVWKLLHDSLPTMATLHNKGISNDDTCPLCNSDEETPTHLFLLCSFSRACWFGLDLGLHTSEIVFVQIWLKDYIISSLNNEDQSMDILQPSINVHCFVVNLES